MRRYLLLLLLSASLCCVFQSCENGNDDDKDKVYVLVRWGVGDNVVFPEGCHIDAGYLEFGDDIFDLSQYDAIFYGYNPRLVALDLRCTINNLSGFTIADICLSNVGGTVLGPDGEGYANSYIYFRGGFSLFLSYLDVSMDAKYYNTSVIVNYNGVECRSECVNIEGHIVNNREYRAKDSISLKYEDITKHIEYTDCNIIIKLEVEGKPLTLNITHISPL